ncbi:MAG: hypothetical protein ACI97N_001167 [Cognaticolwellia sp.]|jgi:hypothetical protein
MKKQLSLLKSVAFATMMVFTFVQCSDDGVSPETEKGEATFEMTDAPIDDASVEAVFVTVTEIKLDGKTYDGFSGKQTINLLSYQEGNTKMLGNGELDAQVYSEITLVLDYETDAMGNAPGCYVTTVGGMKHDLSAEGEATGEIVIQKPYEIKEDVESEFVLDFDVRKAISYEGDTSTMTDFTFVTQAELNSAVRFVKKDDTGDVEGEVEENALVDAENIIVFAYEKGTYDADTEVQGQGESNITFKNAVSSTVVKENGEYKLAFLEEGDYELHFIVFEDQNNDGKMEAKGELTLSLLASLGIDLNDISVGANISVSVNVMITGIVHF